MATTVWKGHVTVGLVTLPVKLYAAARSESISFNQLHAACKSRVKQQLFCPACQRVVERTELLKGHEVETGRFVIIEDADLEKIAPPSSQALQVLEFVRLADVDPIFFNVSYYVVPEPAGVRAYRLLAAALQRAGHVGIARITMHQREHVVILRSVGDFILLHTIFYPDEVRDPNEEVPAGVGLDEIAENELDLALRFIATMSGEFTPSKFRDQHREDVGKLIRSKAEQAVVSADGSVATVDLASALQASIEQHAPTSAAPQKPARRRKA